MEAKDDFICGDTLNIFYDLLDESLFDEEFEPQIEAEITEVSVYVCITLILFLKET